MMVGKYLCRDQPNVYLVFPSEGLRSYGSVVSQVTSQSNDTSSNPTHFLYDVAAGSSVG